MGARAWWPGSTPVKSPCPIMSLSTKLQNRERVTEAQRAEFKCPGHYMIHISNKWGFTKFKADNSKDMLAEKQLIPNDSGV